MGSILEFQVTKIVTLEDSNSTYLRRSIVDDYLVVTTGKCRLKGSRRVGSTVAIYLQVDDGIAGQK